MSASKRFVREQRREIEKCNVYDFCEENGIEKVHINEYQIRLNRKVDVYPTNKKYCILNGFGGKWGSYQNVEELLSKIKS